MGAGHEWRVRRPEDRRHAHGASLVLGLLVASGKLTPASFLLEQIARSISTSPPFAGQKAN